MQLDTVSYNKLFLDCRVRYIRFAQSYLRDNFLAEDFYVDSMMTLWKNREELPDDTNASAYVLRVLKNKCIDHLRHIRNEKNYCEKTEKNAQWELEFRISCLEKFVPEDVFRHEIQEIIKNVLSEQSEESKRVYILSRRDGKSVKEIASALNITEKGVEYHITKVNKVLKVKLKDYITLSLLLFLFM